MESAPSALIPGYLRDNGVVCRHPAQINGFHVIVQGVRVRVRVRAHVIKDLHLCLHNSNMQSVKQLVSVEAQAHRYAI